MSPTAMKDSKAKVGLGWIAADFHLLATDGRTLGLQDVRGPKGLLVIFMCNHCPYVQNALDRIMRDVTEMKELGIGTVGISSNDVVGYPDDNYANMQKLAQAKNLPFPYVIDETQQIARAYDAACTPEFYGFNADMKLAYHGRIDQGGMRQPPVGSPRELFEAMKMIAATGQGPVEQHTSVGCSIKWK